ncbi:MULTISPECIES: SPASM domain-containing protein [unclassified Frankia]|nr:MULTISPECIES: SPASM domain-containing protein [unclassified Frankia]
MHAAFALTCVNQADLMPTYNLAIDLGVRDILAIKFFPGGRGLEHVAEMEFPYPEWAEMMVALTKAKMGGDLPYLALSVPAPWEFYLPLIDAGVDIAEAEAAWGYQAPLREPVYLATGSLGDPSGIIDLNVVANGDVFPVTLMSRDRSALCGNIMDRPLADIWRYSEPLGRLRELTLKDLCEDCRACGIVTICGGGSRARALTRTGRIDGPDTACPRIGRAE